ncbi:hypothetical protein [Trichloromonas sp.]|uniref:hypothetical protein n=1 Tax=Trichloromonas sp. TaxID=3069249 RepID=UPI003D817F89
MKKMLRNISLCVASALMLSGIALASTETPLPTFEKMDVNKDSQVSKEEAQDAEMLTAIFEAADANKDNMLDKDEYALIGKQ